MTNWIDNNTPDTLKLLRAAKKLKLVSPLYLVDQNGVKTDRWTNEKGWEKRA